MYRFDPETLLRFISNRDDPGVRDLMRQLQERDRETPQAVSLIMCK